MRLEKKSQRLPRFSPRMVHELARGRIRPPIGCRGHITYLHQGWRNDSRGEGDYALGALEEKGPQVSQSIKARNLYNYCNC